MLAPRKKLHSTPIDCVNEALNLLELGESDTLCDVGCGDGRVVVAAATARRCRCIGIDINPERIADAEAAVAAAGDDVRARVTLIAGNALEQDLSSATAFFLFLVERGLKIMLPLLQEIGEARVKAGAAKLPVACYLYRIPGVKPTTIQWVTLTDRKDAKYPLYLYSFPLESPSPATSGPSSGSSAAGGEASGGAGTAAEGGAGAGEAPSEAASAE